MHNGILCGMQTNVDQVSAGTIPLSSWSEWDPHRYLQTYFKSLGPDSYYSMRFFAKELQRYAGREFERALDFGAGPTILGSILAAPYVREMHIADYLEQNFEEIHKWIMNEQDAFNWDEIIRLVLKAEGKQPSPLNLSIRRLTIKKTVSKVIHCDASLENPLHSSGTSYPLVLTLFCPDSATSSKEIWQQYMRNISNLVGSNGVLMLAALRKSRQYKCGNALFPSANIDEYDLSSCLQENGYSTDSTVIEVFETPECAVDGFESIMCASAVKNIM